MRATRASLRLLAAGGLAVAAAGCYTVTPFGSINTIATGGQNYIGMRGSQVFPAFTRRRENEATILEGTDTKGHHAVVRLRPESDGTRVRVHARFGLFGDEALSRAYLDRLAARVGQAEGDDKVRVTSGEASPQLKLRADGAVAPPGSLFPRRLDEGVREIPYP
jgi:hypothetical protein